MGCGFMRKVKLKNCPVSGDQSKGGKRAMASVSYSEDLSCCICLTIFTDPVMLHCGHSFCRTCITQVLTSQHQCPQCRTETSILAESLQTNHVLKSLAEKAKDAEKMKKEHRSERAEVCWWYVMCYTLSSDDRNF